MKAEIVGKPSAKFFFAAVEDMQISPEDVSFILIFKAQAGFNILHSFQFKRVVEETGYESGQTSKLKTAVL